MIYVIGEYSSKLGWHIKESKSKVEARKHFLESRIRLAKKLVSRIALHGVTKDGRAVEVDLFAGLKERKRVA